eukprot:scaffold674_cov371-Prasinococcus_capsulatus_cf.AAC.17
MGHLPRRDPSGLGSARTRRAPPATSRVRGNRARPPGILRVRGRGGSVSDCGAAITQSDAPRVRNH